MYNKADHLLERALLIRTVMTKSGVFFKRSVCPFCLNLNVLPHKRVANTLMT